MKYLHVCTIPMTRTIRLVYLDDDPAFTRIVKEKFAETIPGIEFSEVYDPEDFKILISEKAADIVVCGLNLGDMKSQGVIRKIMEDSGNVPVVIFSDPDNASAAVTALKLGACDYVVRCEDNIISLADSVRAYSVASQRESGNSPDEERGKMRRQFRHIFDRAPLGYQSLDAAGCIMDVNPAWTQTLGYAREEVIGKWFGNFLTPQYVDSFRKRFPEFIETGQVHSEFEMWHKDGNLKFIGFDGRVGYYDDGSFDRTYCILQDLTETRQMERKLRESEEKYRHITENMTDVVWTADLELRKNYVSSSVTRLMGFTPEEYIRLPLDRKFTPEALKTIHEMMAQEMENETNPGSDKMRSRIFEVKHYRSDGSTIWVEMNVSFLRDVNGIPIGIQGLTRDISQRKRIEEKLQTNLNLLKIAGRAAKFGGWSVKKGDKWVVWSDNVAAIHEAEPGFSPGIEEGIHFYTPEWRTRISEVFLHCLNEGIPYDEEMEIITAKGNRKWVRTIGEAVRDEYGEITEVHGAFQDITGRKLASEALSESEQNFRDLFNGMTETVWVLDFSGNILDVNETAVRLLGYSKDELISGGLTLVDTGLEWDKIMYLVRTIPDDRKQIFETVHRTRDGQEFPVEIISSVINHRRKRAILSIARDITERKQTENELRSLKSDLEIKVEEKTRELRDRVGELERFHEATINRELRMKELREELNELKLIIQKMKE